MNDFEGLTFLTATEGDGLSIFAAINIDLRQQEEPSLIERWESLADSINKLMQDYDYDAPWYVLKSCKIVLQDKNSGERLIIEYEYTGGT